MIVIREHLDQVLLLRLFKSVFDIMFYLTIVDYPMGRGRMVGWWPRRFLVTDQSPNSLLFFLHLSFGIWCLDWGLLLGLVDLESPISSLVCKDDHHLRTPLQIPKAAPGLL